MPRPHPSKGGGLGTRLLDSELESLLRHGSPHCTVHPLPSYTVIQLQNRVPFPPFSICHLEVNDVILKWTCVDKAYRFSPTKGVHTHLQIWWSQTILSRHYISGMMTRLPIFSGHSKCRNEKWERRNGKGEMGKWRNGEMETATPLNYDTIGEL